MELCWFQALFENSNELEFTKGLGLIKGNVSKMNNDLILPHIGWNSCYLIQSQDIQKIIIQIFFYFSYGSKYVNEVEVKNSFKRIIS